MLSRHSLPRIRIDSLGSYSPHDLSPSTTLNIRDVLDQVVLSPLLAEDFKFDDGNDLSDEGYSQDVPAFPDGHRSPLFIVNSHRAQLPFPLRPEAFELGGFCQDDQYGPLLLTAPTIPRMNLMIMEQLYVQKWVDSLTFDNPPKHIPWTSDTPSPEKKWISEGSIFPADLIKSSVEQNRYIQERPGGNRPAGVGNVSSSRGSRKRTMTSLGDGGRGRSGSRTWIPSPLGKPGLGTKPPLGEMKKPGAVFSQVTQRRVASTPQPLTSSPSIASNGTSRAISSTPSTAPLATRRGKALSELKLGTLIEDLEYPDIPTAFRGSPSIWSPQFDVPLAAPFFTAHQDMLSDLKSKSVALDNAPSTSVQKLSEDNEQWPETETTYVSVGAGEWTSSFSGFTSPKGTLPLQGSFNEFLRVHGDIVADTSIFLPRDFSTPVKDPRLGPKSHPPLSTPTPTRFSDSPPSVPLPPRPALINPSTPPQVRGILKKAKSVRFEDSIVKDPSNRQSSTGPPPPEPVLKPFSPLRQTTIVSPQRPRTPTPSKLNELKGLAKVKNVERILPGSEKHASAKRPTPRPRLTPRRVKSGSDIASLRSKEGNAPESTFALSFKSTLTVSSVDRPCQARVPSLKGSRKGSPSPRLTYEEGPRGLRNIVFRLRCGIYFGSCKCRNHIR